ncbi:hypothetical protein F66182_7009 [Fusarium sp. NRRL 66182]|nr:hypothetical protein F66182_7009 [Fusarium sp. NRRL 66182]
MCNPVRYVYPDCGHPIDSDPEVWTLERCLLAYHGGRDCWIPSDIADKLIEKKPWPNDNLTESCPLFHEPEPSEEHPEAVASGSSDSATLVGDDNQDVEEDGFTIQDMPFDESMLVDDGLLIEEEGLLLDEDRLLLDNERMLFEEHMYLYEKFPLIDEDQLRRYEQDPLIKIYGTPSGEQASIVGDEQHALVDGALEEASNEVLMATTASDDETASTRGVNTAVENNTEVNMEIDTGNNTENHTQNKMRNDMVTLSQDNGQSEGEASMDLNGDSSITEHL